MTTDRPTPEQLARLTALRSRPLDPPVMPAPPTGSDRRQPSLRSPRSKPAELSKIVTAGLSTTLLLGIVTALGWNATAVGGIGGTGGTSPSPVPPEPGAAPVVVAVPAPPPDPVPAPTPAGSTPAAAPAVTTMAPSSDAVGTVVAAPTPVVIELAVPAPQPVSAPAPSSAGTNGTTKQSK